MTSFPASIAVMQPYFIPYAGYFRLFAATDLFVMFDCVQFPRRGWVHRNRLIDASGREAWLTLRLDKAPRDVLISRLRFAADAKQILNRDLRRFPDVDELRRRAPSVYEALTDLDDTPVTYIEGLLHAVVTYLGLRWNVVRSSSLDLPPTLRGQDRIIEIARRLGATSYVNAPGGRDLYDPAAFDAAGLTLGFLPDYPGPTSSILTRIARTPAVVLAREIVAAGSH